jgi:hypothetical protein
MERVLLSVLTFVLLAAPARAQWSVTGMLGDASTSPAQIAIESRPPGVEMDIGPVSFADESSRSPWYYGWRVAYGVKGVPWLAIEAEFIHAKAIADPNEIVHIQGLNPGGRFNRNAPLGSTLPRLELSHGLNVLVGNAVVHWPVVRRDQIPIVEIVGRAGIGPGIPHVEVTFNHRATDEYQLAGWAAAGSIGAEVHASSHLSAVIDLAWTRAALRLDLGNAGLTGEFTTRHIIGGVKWQFAARRP